MEIKEHSAVKQNKINSLDGLKMLAMIAIFLWHSILWDSYIDLGARGCELFFLISGLLVGYNYYKKDVPATWGESFRYVLKKICKFWPLHLFVTVLLFFFYFRVFTFAEIYKNLISLCMLQAWSNNIDIYFAGNGVMWYLSAMMVCHFLSPFLLRLIKKGIRFSAAAFTIVFLIRFSIDFAKAMYPGMLLIDTHVSPVVRSMEFFMGMLMVPFMMCLKELAGKLTKSKRIILFTLIEIMILGGALYLLTCHTGLWRSVCVLMFCPVVFVISINEGIVSLILSLKPFQWFSCIQLEFFILHQALIRLFYNLDYVGFDNRWIKGLMMFIIVAVAAAAYHVLLTGRLEKLMRRLFSRFLDKKAYE